MRINVINKYLYFATALFIIFSACGIKDERSITVSGSTTVEPIVIRAADVFNKKEGLRVRVTGVGSHGGIRALIAGECDIADSSAGITPDEKRDALKMKLEIKEFLIAYDHLVPVVHRTNPVSSLTISQLREIFSGKITSWKELGGADLPLKIVVRTYNSGTRDVWEKFIMTTPETQKATKQPSNSGVLHEVENDPGAIGYISIAFLNAEVKALKVNGRDPSLSNETGGSYPLKRALYLYSDGKKMDAGARSFIVFLLSREGQKIVRESGFIPAEIFPENK